MSLLPILQIPDPRLKLKAKPVEQFDEQLSQTIHNMIETMTHDEGCGLAATQVNIQSRFFVMDISEKQDNPLCFINPEIIEKEGALEEEEGCLSIPGIRAKVKRYAKITTQYQNEQGVSQIRISTGLESRCIQHEIDHLDGIVFIDHLSNLKRSFILKKFAKL